MYHSVTQDPVKTRLQQKWVIRKARPLNGVLLGWGITVLAFLWVLLCQLQVLHVVIAGSTKGTDTSPNGEMSWVSIYNMWTTDKTKLGYFKYWVVYTVFVPFCSSQQTCEVKWHHSLKMLHWHELVHPWGYPRWWLTQHRNHFRELELTVLFLYM